MEKSSENTSDEWADQIYWQVHYLLWLTLWVGVTVEKSLENGLNEADSWVDGTAGDSRSDLNGGVESKADGESVNWHVELASVVLHDLENEGITP